MTTKPALLGYRILELPDLYPVCGFLENDILCESYATKLFLEKHHDPSRGVANLVPVFEGDLDPTDGDIRFFGPDGQVIPEDKLDEHYGRNATLAIKLQTNSGYQSGEMHSISIDQWARISAILNEPQPELTKVKDSHPKP